MAKDQSKSNVSPKYERRAIKEWPESERPREKLLQLGAKDFRMGSYWRF